MANPEGSLSRLHVDHWVPVRIENDHLIRCSQVDPQPTDSRRQDEHVKSVRFDRIKMLNELHPLLQAHIAVHSDEVDPHRLQHGLNDIQNLFGLTENEQFILIPLTVPLFYELHQDLQFARVPPVNFRFCVVSEILELRQLRLKSGRDLVDVLHARTVENLGVVDDFPQDLNDLQEKVLVIFVLVNLLPHMLDVAPVQ